MAKWGLTGIGAVERLTPASPSSPAGRASCAEGGPFGTGVSLRVAFLLFVFFD